MTVQNDTCQKCGTLCIEKDNKILGPLEGSYEWLCPAAPGWKGRCVRSD